MNTFLPSANFGRAAQCLDLKRLNKQITECLQIRRAIADETYGWQRHPAVEMWRGYEWSLGLYIEEMHTEWQRRTARVLPYGPVRPHGSFAKYVDEFPDDEYDTDPWWLDDPERLTESHRAMLYRKDPVTYDAFKNDEPGCGCDLPNCNDTYWWPTHHQAIKESNHMFEKTIEALQARNQNEWEVADALLAEVVPSRLGVADGSKGTWEELAEKLAESGIDYSVSTLRQYRDTAAKWEAESRIDGVSFTAHRSANKAPDRARILIDLKKAKGKVTVADVKAAVGTATSTSAPKQAAASVQSATTALMKLDKKTVGQAGRSTAGVAKLEDLRDAISQAQQLVIDELAKRAKRRQGSTSTKVKPKAAPEPAAEKPKAAPKATPKKRIRRGA